MSKTTVLHVGGLHWATSGPIIEKVLRRRPGVLAVNANAVAQTATVEFDAERTSVEQLGAWVRECGYHCAGESAPTHLCEPALTPTHAAPDAGITHDGHPRHVDHAGHLGQHGPEAAGTATTSPQAPAQPGPAQRHTDHEGHAPAGAAHSPHEMMGHGGHAGMSMDDMVRDMRNRFVVAAVLAVAIMLWSPMGRDMLGFSAPAPFGLRDDVWGLLLSLPVVFYSAWIFFDGAFRALRNRTLDMMVLVAVAVGAGWLYSVGVTLTGGGEVFYEAAAVLTAFVLLGHWFEMRARGGANDAIRTLINRRRRWRPFCATASRSRSRPRTSSWVTCC